ncbi:hypothetical protein [Pseudonocardia sp. HH130629-09]|uniref:hypothetical protein n=1 Tax=Pseudonocardia sp. HH130629-09 TaxID=1641402 RepID=UPI0006CB3DB2|nr:hypothetical protein [Pseudonocardia sp. HH130629-09]ALE85812.1 hypothetical protein XF36_23930 [Pseudonocardia sp. HH130629-09]
MSPVWGLLTFAGVGVLLALMGWAGRRHAATLGAVPGMPAELQRHRIAVIRRGATACLVVGVAFVVIGMLVPLV